MNNNENIPVATSRRRLGIAVVVALVAGAAMATTERLFWQKVIVQLIMPVSVCWLMLTGMLLHAYVRGHRWQTIGLAVTWLTLTISANPFFGDMLIDTLEGQYVDQNPLKMKAFDAVIVLGGGTGENRSGKPELDQGGDRIAVAAQMYHAGKAQTIIVTGSQIESIGGNMSDPADQSYEILRSLAVPADRIQKVAGRNTLEEMRGLAETLPKEQRIGLITSAWHLPRAMRRAQAVGLEVTPVPSDFLIGGGKQTLLQAIPSHDGLHHTSRAMIEYIGMLVGR